MFVEAEGVFHDLETNSSTTARVRRRISDKRGKVFNDDMIIVTGNAACSIAMRNAILAGVPKPLWRRAYETVQATITGDVTTLSVNREKALKALAAFGVKPEQLFTALGREGIEEITVDDIGTLRGMYSALKNGEATVEEMFFGTVKAASQHERVADPLSDEPIKPQQAASIEESQSAPETPAETETALTGEIMNNEHDSGTPEPDADAPPPASASEEAGISPLSASSFQDDELRMHLMDFSRKGLRTVSDGTTAEQQREAIENMIANYRDVVPESEWGKLSTVKISLQAVIAGKRTVEQARSFLAADILSCDLEEIGG
jgi:hypothetical protein